MTTPLLEGLDGVQKMSKSLGNYIGITDAPDEMFGKVMSISDDLMWKYYELLTELTPAEISALKAKCDAGEMNPRNAKVDLAKSIIKDFHSSDAARAAEEEFNRRFVKKEIPDEVEERIIAAGTYKLVDLMIQTQLVESKGEAKRLIEQGGVKVGGEKASNTGADVAVDNELLIQVGKRKFLKVKAKK
jgi:tyrosyl-tRNA synthetase